MTGIIDMKDQIGVKRTHDMLHQEIEGKLSSKKDFYTYLQ